MTGHEQFKKQLSGILDEISGMLIEKNRKYGNSALDPIRVFSNASAYEQILVRLDDKLSRLKNMQPDETEDVISDLIGYLLLLKMCNTSKENHNSFIGFDNEQRSIYYFTDTETIALDYNQCNIQGNIEYIIQASTGEIYAAIGDLYVSAGIDEAFEKMDIYDLSSENYISEKIIKIIETSDYRIILITTNQVIQIAKKSGIALSIVNFDESLCSINFLDENTGVITGENGFISRTEDGGKTWIPINIDSDEFIRDAIYINSNTIIAVCTGGYIHYITNSNNESGLWEEFHKVRISSHRLYTISKNEYKDEFVDGFIFTGSFANEIQILTKGGEKSRTVCKGTCRGGWDYINKISFISESIGFSQSWLGEIMKTIDGGETWHYAETQNTKLK